MRRRKTTYQQYGQQNVELGFGQTYSEGSKRLVNKNGTFNINRVNTIRNFYVDLVKMSWKKFLIYSFSFYALINILFGTLYYITGPDNINVNPEHSIGYQYIECISFSVQTLATVGYGVLHPASVSSNMITSFEALFGILVFAIMTGLCYSRFSKPTAGYKFSDQALIAPYQNINSIQIRVANHSNSNLVEIEASCMFSFETDDNGLNKRIFLNLPLERNKIYFLPLSWTIVHPITPDSPLYGKNAEDLREANAELIVMLKAYDDAYAQTIHGTTSYTFDEIIWGAKFIPSYYTGKNGKATFEINKLGDYTNAELNTIPNTEETTSLN